MGTLFACFSGRNEKFGFSHRKFVTPPGSSGQEQHKKQIPFTGVAVKSILTDWGHGDSGKLSI